jgi:hypothetical protein
MLMPVPENVAGHYQHVDAQSEQALEVAHCATLASSEGLDITPRGGESWMLKCDLQRSPVGSALSTLFAGLGTNLILTKMWVLSLEQIIRQAWFRRAIDGRRIWASVWVVVSSSMRRGSSRTVNCVAFSWACIHPITTAFTGHVAGVVEIHFTLQLCHLPSFLLSSSSKFSTFLTHCTSSAVVGARQTILRSLLIYIAGSALSGC